VSPLVAYVSFPVEFIDEITSADSVDQLLACVAHWLPEILTVDRGSIALLDPDGDLRVFAANGNSVIPIARKIPLDNTHLGVAMRSGTYHITQDLADRDEPDSKALVERGYRSSIVAPLISGGCFYGTLNAASRRVAAFSEDDGKVALVVARWMASQLRISRQMDEIRDMAHRDALTGILNRRAFLEQAQEAIEDANLMGNGVALVLMDLDWFKTINDTFGHAGGDAVLRDFVSKLSAHVRQDDLFARLGGEEFALLVHDEDLAGATILAERLRSAVSEISVAHGGDEIRLTASFGTTAYEGRDDSVEAMLKRADIALYRAKDNGRNRVEALAA